ncbi:acetyltransferase [Haladaptatus sp. DYF46]|uniref:acetyltransferase n=1 Tax=Haladaptatus sp. DYF46 TaxID=2886041 RepID=UPI001E4D90A0|nr:acetyltransferase [Haladaptatus sp. DYF46]
MSKHVGTKSDDGYFVDSYGTSRVTALSEEPTLHDPVIITDSTLGRWTEIRPETRVSNSTIGDYTYLMERVQLDYTKIGRFGNIASDVRLGPTNHPIDRPTAHHFTYRAEIYGMGENDESVFEWRADDRVNVSHDVWIGHGATVLPGVEIGTGAVVASGAVVTHDVDPYTIVGGVPAEHIGVRFDEETAGRLIRSEWWEWSHETLTDRLDAFRDLEMFLERYTPK